MMTISTSLGMIRVRLSLFPRPVFALRKTLMDSLWISSTSRRLDRLPCRKPLPCPEHAWIIAAACLTNFTTGLFPVIPRARGLCQTNHRFNTQNPWHRDLYKGFRINQSNPMYYKSKKFARLRIDQDSDSLFCSQSSRLAMLRLTAFKPQKADPLCHPKNLS
jgi:hypothetical protein